MTGGRIQGGHTIRPLWGAGEAGGGGGPPSPRSQDKSASLLPCNPRPREGHIREDKEMPP